MKLQSSYGEIYREWRPSVWMNCIWASFNGTLRKAKYTHKFSLWPSTVLSLGSLFQWWYNLFIRLNSLWLVGDCISMKAIPFLGPLNTEKYVFISMSFHFISFLNTISVAISSKDHSVSSFYCHNPQRF